MTHHTVIHIYRHRADLSLYNPSMRVVPQETTTFHFIIMDLTPHPREKRTSTFNDSEIESLEICRYECIFIGMNIIRNDMVLSS